MSWTTTAPAGAAATIAAARSRTKGWTIAVERGQALRIAEDQGAEPGPVQPAVRGQDGSTEGLHHTGQPGRTRLHDLPGQRVGVDKHCSELAQARGNHGLP